MDTKAVDSVNLAQLQIDAFNEGYKLGLELAEKIYG